MDFVIWQDHGGFLEIRGKNLKPITIIAYQTRVFFLLGAMK